MSSEPVASKAEPASSREWHYHPDLPIPNSPLFAWPPQPIDSFRWLAKSWLRISERMIFALVAVAMWLYCQPSLEDCKMFGIDWIAQMYLRNLLLMVMCAGGLHLYFFVYKKQGKKRKFDPRDLTRSGRAFTMNNQVLDNMIWTCASGVTVWTAYEALLIWGYANGYVPWMSFSEHPVLFLLWFAVIPVWTSFHFYWIHRLLHWPPLYRVAHSLHHRNVNIGPWSGLSMHPIEHVIYLSSIFIHWIVVSHPIHVFFHNLWNTLGAATTHTGYETLLVDEDRGIDLGAFHHQLHHRYFECNYGNAEMPWDKWFGSFHDGSPEATERVRERRNGHRLQR